MALCIQTLPLRTFTAGDTVRFSLSVADHPASTHTLALTIRNGTSVLTVVGTADGDEFDIVFSAAQTAALRPGQYAVAGVFTETATGDKTTVQFLPFRVLPDLANVTVGPRRAAYNAALAMRDSLISKQIASTTIGDQTFTFHNLDSLQKLLHQMAVEAMEEDRALGIGTGGGLQRIVTRM